MVVNAYANTSATYTADKATECTGSTYVSFPSSQWSDCLTGNGDAVLVNIFPNLPAPTNPRSECSGTRANLSWDAVSGADSYRIRVNNLAASSPGWVAFNDFVAVVKGSYACFSGWCSFPTGLSDYPPLIDISFCPKTSGTCDTAAEFTNGPSNIVMGDPYNWSVQSIDSGGTDGERTTDYDFTCAIPPSLGSLYIKENVNDDPAGVVGSSYGQSGLRSDQSGSNYYNSLRIRQSVSKSSNVALVGTAFTAKGTFAPTDGTLYSLTNSASWGNGFMLVYAVRDRWATVYNPSIPGGAAYQYFYSGRFYVYQGSNGRWYSKPADKKIYPLSLLTPLNVGADPISLPAGPVFYARLLKDLSSRTWGTWGYLKDTYGNESGASLNPINGD